MLKARQFSRKFIPFKGLSILALTGALMTPPAITAAADGRIGINAAVRNTVQTRSANETQLRPAAVRGSVQIGDLIVSGNNSALQVLLLDQSVFTVGANARMVIDRFVYDPDRNASDVSASVARGAFRFMSGRSLSGAGARAITTPVGSIGVRGTIVQGAVGPDVLKILEGQAGLPALTGDPATATLVVLVGPGAGNGGLDRIGAIDVEMGAKRIVVEHPGQAVLMWPGQPPMVFWLSDRAAQTLALLLTGAPSGTSSVFGHGLNSVRVASGDIGPPMGWGRFDFNPTLPVTPDGSTGQERGGQVP